VVSFCGFRWFVGNDYDVYVSVFCHLHQTGQWISQWEPAFSLLMYLFKSSPAGYFYVFFICTIVSYFFLFMALYRKNMIKWGVFFIFALGILIFMNDNIRQGVAVSIVIFAIRYVEEKKFWRYALWVALAVCFHYSAVVALPLYFVRRLRLSPASWCLLLVAVFILQVTGIFRMFFSSIIDAMPIYSHYVKKAEEQMVHQSMGIGILFQFALGMLVALFSKKVEEPIYITLFLVGAMLNAMFTGLFLFERIAHYCVYLHIIVFSYFMTQPNIVRVVKQSFIVAVFAFYSIQSLTGKEKHGAVPYRTVFGEDISNPNYEYYSEHKYNF
jgi:hypothetical protein